MFWRSGGEGPAPWLFVRGKIAEAWHCRPDEIDPVADQDEIGLQLEMWEIEGKYRKKE